MLVVLKAIHCFTAPLLFVKSQVFQLLAVYTINNDLSFKHFLLQIEFFVLFFHTLLQLERNKQLVRRFIVEQFIFVGFCDVYFGVFDFSKQTPRTHGFESCSILRTLYEMSNPLPTYTYVDLVFQRYKHVRTVYEFVFVSADKARSLFGLFSI